MTTASRSLATAPLNGALRERLALQSYTTNRDTTTVNPVAVNNVNETVNSRYRPSMGTVEKEIEIHELNCKALPRTGKRRSRT
jgi:hypothetical protein